MQVKDLKRAIPYLFKTKITPLLIGLHGKGKTSFVSELAQEMDANLLVVRLGTLSDSGDLIGLPAHLQDSLGKAIETIYVAPSFLPVAREGFDNTRKTVLFLDEINRCHKDLIQAIFQLVEKGEQLGPHKLINTHVIAAANPATDDYSVMDISDKAFTDRFCHLAFEPSTQEFLDYGKANFNSPYLNFLSNRPEMIRKKNDLIIIDYIDQSERSAEKICRLELAGLPTDLFLEVASGIVGTEAASAAVAFYLENNVKISGNDIIYNYESVKEKVLKHNMPALALAIDEIEKILIDKKEEPNTQQEIDNFIQFLTDIPADLCIGTIINFAKIESWSNDELVIQNFYGYDSGKGISDTCSKFLDYIREMRKAGKLKLPEEKKEEN
jgi:hypothetical protein